MIAVQKANEIGLYNVLSSYLFPDHSFQFGEKDRYSFRDVDVVLKRVGNRFGQDCAAVTFVYNMEGENFRVVIRTVWLDGHLIRLEIINDVSEDAHYAMNKWLRRSDSWEDAA